MKRLAFETILAISSFVLGAVTLRLVENHFRREWLAERDRRRKQIVVSGYYRHYPRRKR